MRVVYCASYHDNREFYQTHNVMSVFLLVHCKISFVIIAKLFVA